MTPHVPADADTRDQPTSQGVPTETVDDPIETLRRVITGASDDWAATNAKAWVYGIVVGWSDDEGDAHQSLADKYGWPPEAVAKMRELHNAFRTLGRR